MSSSHTESESNRRIAIAVETLDSLVGHHTAHLNTVEQIRAVLWLSRRCIATAEELTAELLTDELVTGDGK